MGLISYIKEHMGLKVEVKELKRKNKLLSLERDEIMEELCASGKELHNKDRNIRDLIFRIKELSSERSENYGSDSYIKEHGSLKAEIKELEEKILKKEKENDSLYDKFTDKEIRYVDRLANKDGQIRDLETRVEQLSLERDMLLKYYKIDEEPTEEQIREMRMNERIFKLELENSVLKARR